jgi:hypothetical protein
MNLTLVKIGIIVEIKTVTGETKTGTNSSVITEPDSHTYPMTRGRTRGPKGRNTNSQETVETTGIRDETRTRGATRTAGTTRTRIGTRTKGPTATKEPNIEGTAGAGAPLIQKARTSPPTRTASITQTIEEDKADTPEVTPKLDPRDTRMPETTAPTTTPPTTIEAEALQTITGEGEAKLTMPTEEAGEGSSKDPLHQ